MPHTAPRIVRQRAVRPALVALALAALCAPSWMAAAQEQPPAPDAPAERATEDSLLAAAFAYLDLSAAQRGQLLWVARQVEGRRRLFADEERRIAAEERRLADREPASAAKLRQLLEEERARMESDVVAFAAPHLVRTLTREQILLAWRLEQGRPPKSEPVDPILLDPAAGFVVAGQGIMPQLPSPVEPSVPLPEEGGIAPPSPEQQAAEAAAAEAAAARERLTAELDRALVVAQERQRRALDLGGGDGSEDLQVAAAAIANPLSNPHFPQRVVESDSVAELAAAIEPFVRRLFASPRLMAVLARARPRRSRAALARPAGSPRLVRHYRLDASFRDATRRGPDLLALGGSIAEGLYRFAAGQGLQLEDVGVDDHYAVEMVFACGAVGGYQKLIDFRNRAADEGLYLFNNRLMFYNLADGHPVTAGAMHRLRLERDRGARLVRAYLDRQPAFAFLDLDGDATFEKSLAFFFVDDRTTTGEQGPGVLASLRIWDRPEGR